ncbi:MAG: ferredoxin family protein [Methylovirgula sp.]|uniref:4Fe-4S dicluster domain-containing protein n=1 Tax=Methylovirgula sp. TaxID=1978224 RepID=UPI00307658FF
MIELIFADRCNGCGACDSVCPTNVFEMGDDNVPYIARQEDCQTCFMCEAHCPTDALYVSPLRTPHPVDREEVLASGILGIFDARLASTSTSPVAIAIMAIITPGRLMGRRIRLIRMRRFTLNWRKRKSAGLVDVSERPPIGQFSEVIV